MRDLRGSSLLTFHEQAGASGGTDGSVEHVPQCSDRVNNDGDLWVDWPADAGCGGPDDDSEAA